MVVAGGKVGLKSESKKIQNDFNIGKSSLAGITALFVACTPLVRKST